jgi:ElaB/YqjD/DUF883 family membrane-anchored ribosome-binding protein
MSEDARPGFGRERLPSRTARAAEPRAARALLCLALLAGACAEAAAQAQGPAQQPPRREDAAPPPMRYLPEETRAKLASARDLKARTRLSLELADARLLSADAHSAADRFDAATLELGVYEAIIKDALGFLKKSTENSKNKQRDLFKRVELALRAHVTRLETLRRGLPSQHAVHVQTTLDFVRDARSEALEAFFDDTVIPERPPTRQPAPASVRATGANAAQPEQPNKP